MEYWRKHKKVFLLWNNWIAFQLILIPEWSFGIRIEPTRPLIDIFLFSLSISIGKHPILSSPYTQQRHSARGFVPADSDESFWIGHNPIDQTKVKFDKRDDYPIL